MHRSTGFRTNIAVDLQPLVSLELKDVVGAVAEKNERDPRQSAKPISQAVLAAVDLLRDGLGVAFAGPAVKVPGVPVEQRHQAFSRIGIDRVRILDEIGAVEAARAAPVAELAIVVLAGPLRTGATAVEVPVAILLRRVAEIGAGVVALLRRRRPPRSIDRSGSLRSHA